ncbi:MAG: hypothetical protein PF495_10070 [Spirochaetales bacterium]|jgi:hypothetical protein|nr:hypothetical protein [Spirochaetales bacterium]
MSTIYDDQFNALKTLDVEWLKQQAINANVTPPTDEVALLSLHKSRYERPDVPKELRHESGHWLRANNYRRIFGAEVLPEGELPE